MSDDPVTDYEIESGVFPAELLAEDRWFVWADSDGRKIPRAPWANTDHIERYVSWKDESMWVDFDTASEWVDKLTQFGHASCIPAYEDNDTERLILFDFDDCRDPDTGAIHPHAWKLIQGQGLHAAISSSGTGLHGYGWGSIPEGYKPSFEHDLEPWEYHDEPALEVYASARFIALTGEHIVDTPVSVPALGETAHELFETFGTERTTGVEREPDISREELADVETTTNVEDIYDAIRHTRPRDIRLRSPVTQEYSGRDANCARDPSWANSESGTRLAEFDDHWLYRKGNHRLDALQVVALEEGIIRDESTYPSGDEFVDAVEALRDRGAHIPELETSRRRPQLDVLADNDGDDSDSEDGGDDDAAEAAAETDGGAVADADGEHVATPKSRQDRFGDDVRAAIAAAEDDDEVQQKTARHRIAEAFNRYFNFVYPETEVRGWRSALYVYNDDEGVYEPRGRAFVEKHLEREAGDYVTNQVTNEIVGKLERMSIARGDRFRVDPNRLCVANGILDLHTGELDAWTPAEFHRTKLDVRWNPDAGEPDAIDDFLHDIVESSDVATLYRLIAHTLYKEYVGEKAAMLVGGGQNGKSVFLDLVERFLGDYNVSHRALQDFEDKFAANQLEGKLANIHPDMGDESVKDMSTFKKLTGRDTMTADVKYESPIVFENYATLMFAANEMPVFGEDNHAVWRRWVYVNFPYTFSEHDEDTKDPIPKRVLMRRLTQKRQFEALLVRCQREIQRWHQGEEWYPDAMRPDDVRKQMKKAAEPVFDFATTCLEESSDEDAWLAKDDVRACYREYATQEGLPKLTADRFGEKLINLRDFSIESARRRVENRRVRAYTGVTWTDRGRQVLGLDEPDGNSDQTTVEDAKPAKPFVKETLRELVDANGGEPVTRDLLVGATLSQLSIEKAQHAIDELKKSGDITVAGSGDGLLPT